MGKHRPRAAEKRVLGQGSIVLTSGSSLTIPPAPVYHPTEDEFKDPLAYIYKIRPEAESYGICKIIPPQNWKPPFALDLDTFSFPTKTQAIHQLQARPPACNSKTFELEYNRFLEEHCGKKAVKKKVVFEGKELDLCKLFNGVKRYGGYDNVVKEKKWGEVFRFVRSGGKISECSKYVLCQLYYEHLYDYESYYSKLDRVKEKSCKRGLQVDKSSGQQSYKRSRTNEAGEKVKPHKVEEEEYDQICEQCRSGLHAEVMLLCDRCNKGWHIYCLSPPLKRVPPGNWYCSECFNSEKDSFGFVPGKQLSLEAFRRVADRAKKKWFGSTSASRVQLEKKFWEIVEGSVGEVEVIYGSDLDTSVYGSGFPRVGDQRPLSSIEDNEWDEYCASPWNLNNLPKLQGSMLRAVHHNIAGVMVPWLYIGMLFSSFCWHFEDHCFYSMNYHHWGEPKCWYSVPGSEASAFEKVMRNSLPDLFDAQPDLLFQLVTMLNPSVLQEHNVPVYSVLQEPGNFVITFPKSYHGGFNFGLNCAEAVNFAPADWLPYGGFGAELYQHYRRPAVLSHEELLCVVAKNDLDSNALPYLKNELLRVYNKEKSWRERLWRNGIINSSPMAPRKQPNYVGVEEDATCIICQQFLYLSAVGCSCRPSAFVCLEHWENLCECKPRKRYLLYRHTLAELNDLVIMMEKHSSEETIQKRNTRKHLPCTNDIPSLSKKVKKGGHVTITQLAEEWLLRSCKILQMPYSNDAYVTALKEAEQFLWAGSEMDPVRELAKNLAEAQNWSEGVRDCLSKIESWACHRKSEVERVKMEDLSTLLNANPVPCNEPGHLKLKGYEEEARELIQKIRSALSTSSNVVDLETLYSKASDSAIYVKESEELSTKLSAVKLWIHTVRNCISEKSPGVIEVDIINNLKSEIEKLQLQVPEVPLFLDFVRQIELCQSRSTEILKGPITLKNLEVLVQEFDGFTVNVPELKLLRQYQSDAFDWISRFNSLVKDCDEREDQKNVVDELLCLKKDGSFLKVQVDELLLIDVELKKASCRVEAWKVLGSKMPLESIQQVMTVATELQIENEKVFKKVSDVIAQAMCLEEKAKGILACEVQMSDFEDVVRVSEDLCALLPCVDDVKDALSMAKSWLIKSKPYLVPSLSVMSLANSLLKVDDLKDLVSESKLMKMYLEERSLLEDVLQKYLQWEHDASSALHDAESLLNVLEVDDKISSDLISKIADQVAKMESIMKNELSLRFDSVVIPKLRETCAILHWCSRALSFRDGVPTLKEVDMLLEDAKCHHVTCAARPFWRSLVDGINWAKQAVEILGPSNIRRFELGDVEEVLRQSKMNRISFPLIVGRLLDAIKRHNSWVDDVKTFFSRSIGDRKWSLLLQLEELGSNDAFNCMEKNMVVSEVERVKEWKQKIGEIVGIKVNDDNLLLNALSQILDTLDRSLYMYDKPGGCNQSCFCMLCSNDSRDQELLDCSVCMNFYHMHCIKPTVGGTSHATADICPYCHIIKSGKISRLKFDAKRPELDMFMKLLYDAGSLCVEIEEKAIIHQVVEKAFRFKDLLIKIVEFSLASLGEDSREVVQKLSNALKAVEVSGIYDRKSNCKFELALARNSWRVRASKLLKDSQKPSIHQIQRLLKEGLTINIPLEDYFWNRLETVKQIGLQWAMKAKKVSADSGALELYEVFELIAEGENLSVHFDKELKLLRERSMLYCICRKPYDQRPMIACDKCDEWYHFDCIRLSWAPKNYICPACKVDTIIDEEKCTSSSIAHDRSRGECEEPQTPSPRPMDLRREAERSNSNTTRKMAENNDISTRKRGGFERLLWRNRKPFRRTAKKRVELQIFSPFFHVHS